MSGTLRLHQICLVAHELAPIEAQLNELFEIEPCHHSDLFGGKFGIHNVVYEIGGAFLEVVGLNPGVDPKTVPAGRYLQRRGGDGGYMVILECNDVERRRVYLEQQGVRIVFSPKHDGFNEIQLHPADTGGSLISLNETEGRHGLVGPYLPAGPDWWRKSRRSSSALEIAAADLQSPDPQALAQRWSRMLERPLAEQDAHVFEMHLDLGLLRFAPETDGRGEGLGGFDLVVTDRQSILTRAARLGLSTTPDGVQVCGTRIRLLEP